MLFRLALLLLLLSACTDHEYKREAGSPPSHRNTPENKQKLDSVLKLLQTGDIVLRTGADMTSYMLRQLNLEDKTYSHCGLAVIEGGQPYIYHSIGGEDNPDEKLRRDPASGWFSPLNNLGIGIVRLPLDSASRRALAAVLKSWHIEEKRFDMRFDLLTDDRMYCSEMVYKCINDAVYADYYQPVKLFGRYIMPIDYLYKDSRAIFICRLDYK